MKNTLLLVAGLCLGSTAVGMEEKYFYPELSKLLAQSEKNETFNAACDQEVDSALWSDLLIEPASQGFRTIEVEAELAALKAAQEAREALEAEASLAAFQSLEAQFQQALANHSWALGDSIIDKNKKAWFQAYLAKLDEDFGISMDSLQEIEDLVEFERQGQAIVQEYAHKMSSYAKMLVTDPAPRKPYGVALKKRKRALNNPGMPLNHRRALMAAN